MIHLRGKDMAVWNRNDFIEHIGICSSYVYLENTW